MLVTSRGKTRLRANVKLAILYFAYLNSFLITELLTAPRVCSSQLYSHSWQIDIACNYYQIALSAYRCKDNCGVAQFVRALNSNRKVVN